MFVDAKEVVFSYDKLNAPALKGINLRVESGDFYGIIGKTGSGKSTFIQHLNGLIKMQKNSGRLTVGEFELSGKCDYKKLRKKVGMVFQYPEYQLFAETVYEDVAFGIKNFLSVSDSEMPEMVKEALTLVGLNYETFKDKSPFELSGGQKRRVAIAGVIITKPEMLVLDEPLAGLDPNGKKEFTALLHKLLNTFVKTVIIVSHDMNLISENCNKCAVFDNGKIVLDGTPKEIFTPQNMEKTGLILPVTAWVTDALRESGIEIESNLTVSDFTEQVAKIWRGKCKA